MLVCLFGEYGLNLVVMVVYGFDVCLLLILQDGRVVFDDVVFMLVDDLFDLVYLIVVVSYCGVVQLLVMVV